MDDVLSRCLPGLHGGRNPRPVPAVERVVSRKAKRSTPWYSGPSSVTPELKVAWVNHVDCCLSCSLSKPGFFLSLPIPVFWVVRPFWPTWQWIPGYLGSSASYRAGWSRRMGSCVMGIASVLILLWSGGNVNLLVVLYSINVFLTFSLSLLGLCIYWWTHRNPTEALATAHAAVGRRTHGHRQHSRQSCWLKNSPKADG